METATKQNVGAAASKSQTHVGLNSGHLMPLVGWGTALVSDKTCFEATKSAIDLGYRVPLWLWPTLNKFEMLDGGAVCIAFGMLLHQEDGRAFLY